MMSILIALSNENGKIGGLKITAYQNPKMFGRENFNLYVSFHGPLIENYMSDACLKINGCGDTLALDERTFNLVGELVGYDQRITISGLTNIDQLETSYYWFKSFAGVLAEVSISPQMEESFSVHFDKKQQESKELEELRLFKKQSSDLQKITTSLCKMIDKHIDRLKRPNFKEVIGRIKGGKLLAEENPTLARMIYDTEKLKQRIVFYDNKPTH